jgi:hypothetical protein
MSAITTTAEESGLDRLERLARAATQGQWEYGSTPVATSLEALNICHENILATKAPVDQFYEVFLEDGRRTALIGNGPTSAANAEYIAALHPANVLHLVSLARPATAPAPEVAPFTYTVDGVVMSPLEYIDYLHGEITTTKRKTLELQRVYDERGLQIGRLEVAVQRARASARAADPSMPP